METDGRPVQLSRDVRSRAGFAIAVIALVCLGTAWRLHTAFGVPALSNDSPLGLLRTDQALIYYISDHIVDGGGLPPADFRADPRVEWPLLTDIPAMFTVGQEFLVAWAHLAVGGRIPLHHVALYLMSFVTSLAVVGVVGLGRELTKSHGWGLFGGLIYLVTLGSYRTPGYLFLREDLSLPLFMLHLYLLARALRMRTMSSVALAALAAVFAVATWHAMGFIFTIEVACAFAWFLRTGQSPAFDRKGLGFLLILIAGSLLVPVLRSKHFILSPPMLMLVVMTVAPAIPRPSVADTAGGRAARAGMAAALLVLLAIGANTIQQALAPGADAYSHVVDMMKAKVRHFGVLPSDPTELSYGARLLWRGPFKTGSMLYFVFYLGILTTLAPLGWVTQAVAWWKGTSGRSGPAIPVLAAMSVVVVALALLVERLIALAALILPVVTVCFLSSWYARRDRVGLAAVLAAQITVAYLGFNPSSLEQWYHPSSVAQLRGTLAFIKKNLDSSGAMASDFYNSSAVLAHTNHPVLLQPKYETARSRERIERFVVGLYQQTPEEFRRILRSEFKARYLLIDSAFLRGSRYEAGFRDDGSRLPPASAAFRLLDNDKSLYDGIPGYRLLFESRPHNAPRYRLYDLADERVPPEQ